MRKLLLVVAAAGLLLVALAPVAVGDDDNEFRASLNGYLESRRSLPPHVDRSERS